METSISPSKGIFDGANADTRESVVEMLTKAYWMEIETVISYLAASVNLDGVRAQEIKQSLEEDVEEELGHAHRFARRIKELYRGSAGVGVLRHRTGLSAAGGGAD
jgi:bacterioferritin